MVPWMQAAPNFGPGVRSRSRLAEPRPLAALGQRDRLCRAERPDSEVRFSSSARAVAAADAELSTRHGADEAPELARQAATRTVCRGLDSRRAELPALARRIRTTARAALFGEQATCCSSDQVRSIDWAARSSQAALTSSSRTDQSHKTGGARRYAAGSSLRTRSHVCLTAPGQRCFSSTRSIMALSRLSGNGLAQETVGALEMSCHRHPCCRAVEQHGHRHGSRSDWLAAAAMNLEAIHLRQLVVEQDQIRP